MPCSPLVPIPLLSTEPTMEWCEGACTALITLPLYIFSAYISVCRTKLFMQLKHALTKAAIESFEVNKKIGLGTCRRVGTCHRLGNCMYHTVSTVKDACCLLKGFSLNGCHPPVPINAQSFVHEIRWRHCNFNIGISSYLALPFSIWPCALTHSSMTTTSRRQEISSPW
jgi:hypothetical protein